MRWLSPRNRWAQRYGSLVVLVPMLLLLAYPVWAWRLLRGPLSKALIVDKTVGPGDTREHDSLRWVLQHNKVQLSDYVGPHYQGDKLLATSSVLQSADLDQVKWLFLADTYGIYRESSRDTRDLEKIVGGLDDAEIGLIEKFVASGGSLYGEFNCLAFPTRGAARQRLERLFGVQFSGWTGRYFPDLADPQEVPGWMRLRFKRSSGPGYVLLHEDGRVVVLVEGQDVPPGALQLQASDGQSAPFAYWFDIVKADSVAAVTADFRWRTSPSGWAKLTSAHIPLAFPAVVAGAHSLYCCGDFSDNPCPRGPYWLEGWPLYNAWSLGDSDQSSARFFWTVYVPLVGDWLKF